MRDPLHFSSRVPVTVIADASQLPAPLLLERYTRQGHQCRVVLIQESAGSGGSTIPHTMRQVQAIPADGTCICRTLRGDPVRLLGELAELRHRGALLFDEVVIHAVPASDRSTLAQRLAAAPELGAVYQLADSRRGDPSHRPPNRSRKPAPAPADALAESATDALIGRLRAVAEDPEPDITSYVFRSDAPFHFQRLGKFMASVLQVYGNDLLRYKGVLQFSDCPYRVNLWGSRILMGSEAGDPWRDGETRESRLIFVGRRLPREVLADGLSQCLHGPEASWQIS